MGARPSTRESLVHLKELLNEPDMVHDHPWYEELNLRLEELEQALAGEGPEPKRSDALTEIRRAHPRLISICDRFRSDGQELLRRAALVVRLSARQYDAGKAPYTELRAATESLIAVVERHLDLEAELAGEMGRDLGGEG